MWSKERFSSISTTTCSTFASAPAASAALSSSPMAAERSPAPRRCRGRTPLAGAPTAQRPGPSPRRAARRRSRRRTRARRRGSPCRCCASLPRGSSPRRRAERPRQGRAPSRAARSARRGETAPELVGGVQLRRDAQAVLDLGVPVVDRVGRRPPSLRDLASSRVGVGPGGRPPVLLDGAECILELDRDRPDRLGSRLLPLRQRPVHPESAGKEARRDPRRDLLLDERVLATDRKRMELLPRELVVDGSRRLDVPVAKPAPQLGHGPAEVQRGSELLDIQGGRPGHRVTATSGWASVLPNELRYACWSGAVKKSCAAFTPHPYRESASVLVRPKSVVLIWCVGIETVRAETTCSICSRSHASVAAENIAFRSATAHSGRGIFRYGSPSSTFVPGCRRKPQVGRFGCGLSNSQIGKFERSPPSTT